jgi:hypothetical protein
MYIVIVIVYETSELRGYNTGWATSRGSFCKKYVEAEMIILQKHPEMLYMLNMYIIFPRKLRISYVINVLPQFNFFCNRNQQTKNKQTKTPGALFSLVSFYFCLKWKPEIKRMLSYL